VVRAVLNGETTIKRHQSSDMWSVGATLFELASQGHMFREGMSTEEVAAELCMPQELELPGLQNVDENLRRLIEKLLVKDPELRWSAGRALEAKLFKSMDNTTRQEGSAAAVAQQLRSQSEHIEAISGAHVPPRRHVHSVIGRTVVHCR